MSAVRRCGAVVSAFREGPATADRRRRTAGRTAITRSGRQGHRGRRDPMGNTHRRRRRALRTNTRLRRTRIVLLRNSNRYLRRCLPYHRSRLVNTHPASSVRDRACVRRCVRLQAGRPPRTRHLRRRRCRHLPGHPMNQEGFRLFRRPGGCTSCRHGSDLKDLLCAGLV